MKYPTHVIGPDGQPDLLCYHRLTGLEPYTRLPAVAEMVREGFVWRPAGDRGGADDDWEGGPERFGRDPIDELAGDGGAVFFSPGAAPNLQWGGYRPPLCRFPGVAFRLSTLLQHGPTVFRPRDAQTVYNGLLAAVEEAAGVPLPLRVGGGSPPDRLQVGPQVFEAARELYDAPIKNWVEFTKLILSGGWPEPPPYPPNPRVMESLVDAFEQSVWEYNDEPEKSEADIRQAADEAISELYGAAEGAYLSHSDTQEVVLFPREGLPLAVAEFMFFDDRMVSLVDGGAPAESALAGLSGPGGYLIARRVRGARVGRLRPRGIPARRRSA
ncbi:MAG: hypothetical protein GY772_29315 [bacterium]|nr:hypothetical protein [bacterium]